MVLEAVRLSTQDEAARRDEAEVVEAVRLSSQDDALRRAREDNERAQLDMVIAETQEDAELARALEQSCAVERDRREADELARLAMKCLATDGPLSEAAPPRHIAFVEPPEPQLSPDPAFASGGAAGGGGGGFSGDAGGSGAFQDPWAGK